MAEIDFKESYIKCLTTFNNLMQQTKENLEAENDALEKAKIPQEKVEHLAEKTIILGKLIMLDKVIRFMFHELGMEVERDDFRDRFDTPGK